MKSTYENEKRKEFINSLKYSDNKNISSKERYHAPKRTAQKVKQQARIKQIRTRVGSMLLAGLIAFGGVHAYNQHKDNTRTITIEQAIRAGKTPDELGIDDRTITKIIYIEQKLEDKNITNSELLKIVTEIPQIGLDVNKLMLSNVLNIDEKDIVLNTERYEGAGETVKIGDSVYTTQGKENTISKPIAQSIRDIGEMQGFVFKIQDNDFDRENTIKQCKKNIKKIDRYAAGDMKIDEKGNISMQWTTEKELDQKQDENDR